MLKIAIVGLPNAGKSTLFNRLVKRKASVISNTPGITRDRREGIGRISNLEFKVVDTGGWNDQSNFSAQIVEQIEFSLLHTDIIFFLVDAKIENNYNQEFAKWLKKKTNKPTILIANKCESPRSQDVEYLKFFNFTDIVYISAEHNLGMVDLHDALLKVMNKTEKLEEEDKSDGLRVAVIGRPNVGKSTFLNELLSENRLIVSSEPGTTRDSVDVSYNHNNNLITLIDTAGIRRKVDDKLELQFIEKSIESIKRSHVVVLMLDSACGIEQQDLAIVDIAIKEGKGIVVALNKWDLISKDERSKLIKFVKLQEITKLFLEVPIITISAFKGIRCGDVIDKCFEMNNFLRRKISTSKLNNWLVNALDKHSHPLVKGKAIKMKYLVQVGTQPPAFSLICNILQGIDESYKRYLIQNLRKNFFSDGVPIRLILKKNKNPYVK